MALVTDPVVKLDSGEILRSDIFGNDIAIICPNCNASPVILVAVRNMKGASLTNPSTCKVCGCMFSIVSDLNNNIKEIVIKAN